MPAVQLKHGLKLRFNGLPYQVIGRTAETDKILLLNDDTLEELRLSQNEIASEIAKCRLELIPDVSGSSEPELLLEHLGKDPINLSEKASSEYKRRSEYLKAINEIKRRMTSNGDLTVLKAVLNFAFREGKVSSDGAWRVVQAFRGVHRSKAPYLTLEQCQKLIPLCTPDFRLLVCAALLTGARLMELTRLTAEDYNARAGTVHFAPAKTRWARHVFLTDEGREFFDERVKNLLPGDLLFRRQDGERWRQADPCHRLRIPAREAGLGHISFHIFRHTYASLLAEQGTNMAVIAKNMGHRQTEVCERYYAHLSEGYVAKEIRARLPVLGVK